MNIHLAELIEKAKELEQELIPAPAAAAPKRLLVREADVRDAVVKEKASLASKIDHTILKPEATPEQVEKLCTEAAKYHFASVCVNPVYVPLAQRQLADSGVAVCTVVGFPLGATLTGAKVEETRLSMAAGATEIDMVIPVGLMKGGQYSVVAEDIQRVVEMSHGRGALVKVILEMALLNRFEKVLGCLISQAVGAEFVKTSTGFGPGGATVEDVALMRRVVGPGTGVKAAGGIRSLKDARAMVQAGATRLGTSAGVKIIEEEAAEEAPLNP